MGAKVAKHIPNVITSLNLFSGCVACVWAFQGQYKLALFFVLLSALFDFCDGLVARALDAYSNIGKDLDSLADDVSFGVAPSIVVYSLLTQMSYPGWMSCLSAILPYAGFLISVFSALRLAKFNNDTRQTSSFIGLAVPANALFWCSLAADERICTYICSSSFCPLLLILLVGISAWMLVSEIPMFSLKFKNLSWSDNRIRFIFLIGCLPLLLIFQFSGFAAIIIWYIILSVLTNRCNQQEEQK